MESQNQNFKSSRGESSSNPNGANNKLQHQLDEIQLVAREQLP